MTDTREQHDAEPTGEHLPIEGVAIDAAEGPRPIENRLLVPLLLPILAIVGVAFLAINISRVFLASSSTVALVIAVSITVTILSVAALLSAAPRIKSSSMTMLLSTFALVVFGGGLLTLGPSLQSEHGGGEAAGYQEPAGEPVATLAVTALASTRFDRTEYTLTPSGVAEIDFLCDGCGTHTLVFTDPKFAGFKLAVPQGPTKKKVELAAGDYTIYCDIPGHRALGMEATVTVTG